MCEQEGAGNWADKSLRFSSGKSAASLRERWEAVLSREPTELLSGLDRKQKEALEQMKAIGKA